MGKTSGGQEKSHSSVANVDSLSKDNTIQEGHNMVIQLPIYIDLNEIFTTFLIVYYINLHLLRSFSSPTLKVSFPLQFPNK